MTLSPGIAKDILEAAEDNEITTTEVENIMTGVFNSAIAGTVLVWAATMFVKVVSPPKSVGEDIIKIAEAL